MDAEERALLAAIIANPEEDTPRLVYADWLDEHADDLPAAPQASAKAKAELIRLQIERSTLIFGAKGFEKRDNELGDRIEELEEDYRRTWVRELPTAARRRGVRFALDRGLLGEVECSVKFFIEAGAVLVAAAPVMTARLDGLTPLYVSKLAKSPQFTRLRTLKIYADGTPHDVILQLLDSAPVSQLTALHLDNWAIDYTEPDSESRSDSLIERLAAMPKLAGLKWLNLLASAVGARGGEALAQSPHLANLEVLDLRENPSLGIASKALRKKFGKRVWLEYDDRKGFPVRYMYRYELPGS
ncbi:MAG: TIGR02996 domain-containing protein [Planctomycetia bacterium]|nr:TIGR02996 domain-containing protein [Planctomycetia bacterium]